MDKFSICKRDACVHVEGQWAENLAFLLFVVIATVGTAQVVKMLR
jgi:hypothetical protein